ncbi:hypothetical protein HYT25_01185 [Candidatus Pacearchaeota archaeon]|nr:hypothetical protein [Candidatus Pacearchaeota archaeon]
MGMIRGILIWILSVLLLISLTFGNLALTLSLSIGQENFREDLIKNIASVISEETGNDEQLNISLQNADEYCENKNNTEFTLESEGTEIRIPCEKISEGSDAVIEESVNDMVFEQESNENVECDNAINCFAKYKNLLFSEEARNYWNKMFYFSLFASLILVGIMFFIVEEKLSLPISLGILVLISSVPFFVINFILPAFRISFLKPVSILFSQSYFVFLLMLSVGIALLILGFGIKFFKLGYKISEMFSKKSDKKSNKKGEMNN